MRLTRTIHPVGQGGFYSETIQDNGNETTIIYDCGGKSKAFMASYLDKWLYGRPRIDAVFISHLHDDHVNGLEHLLTHTNVRYLFLPQMTPDMLCEAIVYNSINGRGPSGRINEFIIELWRRSESNQRTRIVQINPPQGESGEFELTGDGSIGSMIESGTRLLVGKRWMYIPYNPPIDQENDYMGGFYQFFKEMIKVEAFYLEDLPGIVRKIGTKKCREIYEKYFGPDHNAYSMTVFSGNRRWPEWIRVQEPWVYRAFETPNCLYTGDFDANRLFNKLRDFYSPFWDDISSIQVPHHGSDNNYHPSLYGHAVRGFVSVGEQNRYHHPSLQTIMDIRDQGCCPLLVTERASTQREYQYII